MLRLPEKREQFAWGLVIILGMVLYVASLKLAAKDRALAARPAEAKTAEKRVQINTGRIITREKFIHVDGVCEPQVVERVIEAEPVFEVRESVVEKVVTPACPDTSTAEAKKRYLRLASGADYTKPRIGAGLTIFDGRFDLGPAYDFKSNVITLEGSLRW